MYIRFDFHRLFKIRIMLTLKKSYDPSFNFRYYVSAHSEKKSHYGED